jgi:hypothetical protein
VFLAQVEGPVGVEVAVGVQGAQLEDGFGAVQAPAGAGDVQPVADQMPTCSLDHAGGDRPAALKRGVVAQELPLGGQVGDAGIHAAPLGGGKAGVGGLLAERGDDGVDLAGEELEGVGGDPGLGGGIGVLVEAGCRTEGLHAAAGEAQARPRAARTSMSANPSRLRPRQAEGRWARSSSGARPMPQMESTGLASTRIRPRVPSR